MCGNCDNCAGATGGRTISFDVGAVATVRTSTAWIGVAVIMGISVGAVNGVVTTGAIGAKVVTGGAVICSKAVVMSIETSAKKSKASAMPCAGLGIYSDKGNMGGSPRLLMKSAVSSMLCHRHQQTQTL